MMRPSTTLTLADAARLAKVERPVVSMWRTRLAESDSPFPDPLSVQRGGEVFDGHAVASWLIETRHGNNPDAVLDLEAHSVVTYLTAKGEAAFGAMTALLALAAVRPSSLTASSVDGLLDLANECDPDDDMLVRELEASGDQLLDLASMAERMVDADYNAAVALERLMAARHRLGLASESRVSLTIQALDLIARIASELLRVAPGADSVVVVDVTHGSGDALVALCEKAADELEIALPDSNRPAVRLARRRLLVRGVVASSFAVDATGDFGVVGPAVHVVQLPSADAPRAGAANMLTDIERVLAQFDDSHSGLVVGPASLLVEPLDEPSLDARRSKLLRQGHIRAIVALPAGLSPARPRESTALWVLGSAHASVPLADRWTLVADLSATVLTGTVVTDLVSDLIAALGSPFDVRAHSFAFARPVYLSRLLAQGGALRSDVVPAARRKPVTPSDLASAELEALNLPFALESSANSPSKPITVESAIASGHLRYLVGTRSAAAEATSHSGARVVGVAELAGATAPRFVDRLAFAATHPSAQLTQPGDVVFCTAPRNAAIVDADGSSVVEYPARILRISSGDPGGLVAEVIARDINAAPRLGSWRRWLLHRVPQSQSGVVTQALRSLAVERAAAESRLIDLDRAADLITSAVSSGTAILQPSNPKGS